MKKLFLIIFSVLTAMSASALELPEIFGDHMMLQQNTKAKIWGWAKAGSVVQATVSWNNQKVYATADSNGRWELQVSTSKASFAPQSVTIKGDGESITCKDVLIGEVWFCSGQSNMEMPLRGFWNCPVEGANEAIAQSGKYKNAIRVVTIPKTDAMTPAERVTGKWVTCEPKNAPEFTACGYFFARTLTDILNVPVGIISCAWGGSCVEGWMPREILETYPDKLVNMDDTDYHRKMVMYNGMLYPLAGYTIKGFLWNQGESNVGRHQEYAERFADMIHHWRKIWNQPEDKLPVYAVELPAWRYGNAEDIAAAQFRVAQHAIEKILDNYGCASTTDLLYPYEMDQVHGCRKQEIGQRLAYLAATRDYGVEGIGAEAPQFEFVEQHEASETDMQVVAGTAVEKNKNEKGTVYHLYFTNSEDGFDLLSDIEGFEVLGSDGQWHKATVWSDSVWQGVKRQGCFLKLSCEEAGEIEGIRYAFHNGSIGKLHNLRGLPVVPFEWLKNIKN